MTYLPKGVALEPGRFMKEHPRRRFERLSIVRYQKFIGWHGVRQQLRGLQIGLQCSSYHCSRVKYLNPSPEKLIDLIPDQGIVCATENQGVDSPKQRITKILTNDVVADLIVEVSLFDHGHKQRSRQWKKLNGGICSFHFGCVDSGLNGSFGADKTNLSPPELA